MKTGDSDEYMSQLTYRRLEDRSSSTCPSTNGRGICAATVSVSSAVAATGPTPWLKKGRRSRAAASFASCAESARNRPCLNSADLALITSMSCCPSALSPSPLTAPSRLKSRSSCRSYTSIFPSLFTSSSSKYCCVDDTRYARLKLPMSLTSPKDWSTRHLSSSHCPRLVHCESRRLFTLCAYKVTAVAVATVAASAAGFPSERADIVGAPPLDTKREIGPN
mmetsp:Transcript_13786/g.50200  ORF Transcript_13786/g.50200 Transcript_13786/m.50200 type:complete len:222 (+) Transcript_13786:2083-2748(+)